MALQQQIVTAEQFDMFIQRADLGDQIFEFIGGEIVTVPSNPYASAIAATILAFLKVFVGQRGHITGADGGYIVAGERYAPDVAYISKARQPELARQGFNPNPPELAVEVVSDEQNARELRDLRLKITGYLAAGTVVWVVYPTTQIVEIHRPGEPAQIVGMDGVLDGGDVLPGFRLALTDIFPVE
jgi:Uma2 family endonuclease